MANQSLLGIRKETARQHLPEVLDFYAAFLSTGDPKQFTMKEYNNITNKIKTAKIQKQQ